MLPLRISPTPGIIPTTKSEFFKQLGEGIVKNDPLQWIKVHMTGDQLVPDWGSHKQEIWFTTDGGINPDATQPEDESMLKLRLYLRSIYQLWLKSDRQNWKDHEIDERINVLFREKSQRIAMPKIKDGANATEKEEHQNHEKKAKESRSHVIKSGRYALLAADYYEHIKSSSNKLPFMRKQVYAIAIYSSARYLEMLAIARGESKGNVNWSGSVIQDLWFLIDAILGIKKLSLIFDQWITMLTTPSDISNLSEHSDKHAYLRRDMECSESMIESLFYFNDFTERDGNFIRRKEANNKPFIDKGMMSTTYEVDGVAPYSTNSNVVLFIQVDKTKRGKYNAIPLDRISRLPLEKEILWAPRTKFEILAIRDNRKKSSVESDWRGKTREWSETEKLCIYMRAPLSEVETMSPTKAVESAETLPSLMELLTPSKVSLLPYFRLLSQIKEDDKNQDIEIGLMNFAKFALSYLFSTGTRQIIVPHVISKQAFNIRLNQHLIKWKSDLSNVFKVTEINEEQVLALKIYCSLWRCIKIYNGPETDLRRRAIFLLSDTFEKVKNTEKILSGPWFKFDINSNNDVVEMIKDACKINDTIIVDMGLMYRNQEHNRIVESYNRTRSKEKKIIWKIDDLSSVPTNRLIPFNLGKRDRIIISPDTKFLVTDFKEQDSLLEVSLKYIDPKSTPSS